MDIRELKEKIENNTLDDAPLILKHQDNLFICHQYIDAICKNKHLKKLLINSVNEITRDDLLFDTESPYLYVIEQDKFTEMLTAENTNVIVVCKEITQNLPIDFIDIPKLVGWQIEDYIKMRLPGLDELEIKWLCDICKNDIYMIDNECKKLEIFPVNSQKEMFNYMNMSDAYCYLNSLTIFNFTNAVMKKDIKIIHEVLANLKYIDIEGTGLITIFHKQFKNLIDIQMSSNATATSLNMNPKQFNAIKYNVGKYSDKQLIDIYEFLTGLDIRLKNGEFQFEADNRKNNAKFVEYITLNLMTLGNIK